MDLDLHLDLWQVYLDLDFDFDLWDVYLDLHNQLTLPFKASCPFLKLQHKGEVEFRKCNFLIVERKRGLRYR